MKGKALTEEEFEKLNEPLQSKKIEGLGPRAGNHPANNFQP